MKSVMDSHYCPNIGEERVRKERKEERKKERKKKNLVPNSLNGHLSSRKSMSLCPLPPQLSNPSTSNLKQSTVGGRALMAEIRDKRGSIFWLQSIQEIRGHDLGVKERERKERENRGNEGGR